MQARLLDAEGTRTLVRGAPLVRRVKDAGLAELVPPLLQEDGPRHRVQAAPPVAYLRPVLGHAFSLDGLLEGGVRAPAVEPVEGSVAEVGICHRVDQGELDASVRLVEGGDGVVHVARPGPFHLGEVRVVSERLGLGAVDLGEVEGNVSSLAYLHAGSHGVPDGRLHLPPQVGEEGERVAQQSRDCARLGLGIGVLVARHREVGNPDLLRLAQPHAVLPDGRDFLPVDLFDLLQFARHLLPGSGSGGQRAEVSGHDLAVSQHVPRFCWLFSTSYAGPRSRAAAFHGGL
ncbi:hypothetical protein AB0F11_01225 [Streptomyces sp. NPDC032472]|uniref:hypothetical protein n=1 Tax=Streptomyces sp. NPDC032472 TaxID=3155018 RepID=UPI0033C7C8E9